MADEVKAGAESQVISEEQLRKAEEYVQQEEGAANRLAGWVGTVVAGIAVTMTMVITTMLAYVVAREQLVHRRRLAHRRDAAGVGGGGHGEASLLQADLHHAQTLRVPVDEQQVWFPGVHCDVGGSYAASQPDSIYPAQRTGLSDASLRWMINEVAAEL